LAQAWLRQRRPSASPPGPPMSGRPSRRRPDGPEDANPLNRRLPAEVVSRRRRVEPPAAAEADESAIVTLDRKTVFALKPPQREKWLRKALKQVAESLIRSSDIYDVIASTRFTEDVPYKLGQKMARAVQQQLTLFSGKQQRILSAEATLAVKFGKAPEGEPEAGKAAEEAPADAPSAEAPGTAEEMMARCRAFVRERLKERDGEAPAEQPPGGGGAEAAAEDAAPAAEASRGRPSRSPSSSKAGRRRRSPSRKGRRPASSSSSSSSSRAVSSDAGAAKKAEKRRERRKRRRSSSSSSTSPRKRKRRDSKQ